MILEQDLWRR